MLGASFSPSPLAIGQPQTLFEGRFAGFSSAGRNYDLSPDGQRFLMIAIPEPPPAPTRIHLVRDWLSELAELVPPP